MPERVAITVRRRDGLSADVDPRFGRATAFVIVDPDSYDVLEEYDNDLADEAAGAGTAVAAKMSGAGVQAVISGAFGPKAYQSLSKLGIAMWLSPVDLTAVEALDRYVAGTLDPMAVRTY